MSLDQFRIDYANWKEDCQALSDSVRLIMVNIKSWVRKTLAHPSTTLMLAREIIQLLTLRASTSFYHGKYYQFSS